MAKSTLRAIRLRNSQQQLTEKMEIAVESGVIASFLEICDAIMLDQVVEALARQDTEAAIDALNIEDGAFLPLYQSYEKAFVEGGLLAVSLLPKIEINDGPQ